MDDKYAIAAYNASTFSAKSPRVSWEHLTDYWRDYWRHIAKAVLDAKAAA